MAEVFVREEEAIFFQLGIITRVDWDKMCIQKWW